MERSDVKAMSMNAGFLVAVQFFMNLMKLDIDKMRDERYDLTRVEFVD